MNSSNKNSVDQQYLDLLLEIQTTGKVKTDRTGTGTISIFAKHLKIDMSQGFPLLTTKEMSLKNIASELLWFMRGQTSLRPLLRDKNYIWVGDAYKKYVKTMQLYDEVGDTMRMSKYMISDDLGTLFPLTKKQFISRILVDEEFNDKFAQLGPIYGKQWRDFNGIDQLQNVIDTLISNPDNRRLLVSAWDPSSLVDAILPPCHIMFQFYSKELDDIERHAWANDNGIILDEFDKGHMSLSESLNEQNVPTRALSLNWYQRSVDTPLGLPYNIASYGLLLHIIAKITNHAVDTLSCALGDTHIYLDQINGVKTQLERVPRSSPTLKFTDDVLWSSNIDECLQTLSTSSFILAEYYPHDRIDFPLSN